MINLRLLGMWPQMRIKPLERLYPLMWWGFFINAVTGTMLLLGDAATKLRNPDFYFKMVLIAIGVIVLRKMRTTVFANPNIDRVHVLTRLTAVRWMPTLSSGKARTTPLTR